MSDAPLADADARAQALDIHRSFIVQAPAGSGKTGLLTRRFLRLLSMVEQPEEILAITFTRKAASEMRARIVAALEQARDGVVPDDAFAAAIVEDARAALRQDERQQWQLLEMPMRLQIMTVDALNSRLVRAMPFTARAGKLNIVDTPEQHKLYADAADSLLEWLTDDSDTGQQVRQFFGHLDGSVYVWRSRLQQMLATREQWLGLVLESGDVPQDVLRARSERALGEMAVRAIKRADQAFTPECRSEFLALAGQAQARLAEQKPEAPLAAPLPERWPVSELDSLSFWRLVSEWCLTREGQFRRSINKTIGFPPQHKVQKDAFQALLASLSANDALAIALKEIANLPDPVYSDAQWQMIVALLALLPLAAAELQRLMSARSVIDYPSLAGRAIDALGDTHAGTTTDLALRLDYRIRHLLVDEMQDTSVAQYRLLEALTAGWQPDDGHTLFCVGDPMQSIYRFRGADVSRFLLAWDNGIGDYPLETLNLTTNFRSDQKIVHWVNETFADLMGDDPDPLMDAVAYCPSVTPSDTPSSGAVQWHLGIDDLAPGGDAVVTLIRTLQERYPGQSIAVLARARGALEPVLLALQHAEIPCEAVEMDRLTDRAEIIDLLCLTRILAHPADRIAWLGILRAPFIGLSLQQIDALVCKLDAVESPLLIPECLRDPHFTAHLDAHTGALLVAFIAAYRSALQRSATLSLRDRVEHVWCVLGGPALLDDAGQLDNVVHYLDTLESLEREGQLDSVATLEAQLDDRRVTRLAPGTNVFAMTIFKSKGLEFDHVILPQMQRRSRANSKPSLFLEVAGYRREQGLLFSVDTARDKAGSDRLHEMLWRREQQRASHELDRLLYVACTRARKSLHLFAGATLRGDGETLGRPPGDSLLGRLWPIAEPLLEALPRPSAAVESVHEGSVWLTPRRRQMTEPWIPPAVAPIPLADARFTAPQRTAAIEFDWAGANARHIGTVVHGWLFQLAGQPDPVAALAAIDDLARRSRRLLAMAGVPATELDSATARVCDALQRGVDCDTGRWLLANSHPDSKAEFALGALLDDQVVQVSIDRLLRDEAGDLWIVDYKTSLHEGGQREAFFASEADRYRPQLMRYRKVIRRYYAARRSDTGNIRLALYFPHYGYLHELSADDH